MYPVALAKKSRNRTRLAAAEWQNDLISPGEGAKHLLSDRSRQARACRRPRRGNLNRSNGKLFKTLAGQKPNLFALRATFGTAPCLGSTRGPGRETALAALFPHADPCIHSREARSASNFEERGAPGQSREAQEVPKKELRV